MEIYYQAGPKRLYRIANDRISGDWVEVPSMSDILSILDKPALVWWGMKIGIEGALQFCDKNPLLQEWPSTDDIVEWLKQNKLTVNHTRDKAAARGTSVHDALEVWAKTGKLAPPNAFNEEERGYVMGVNEFLTDSKAEAVASEVMVASLEWGYAGRFDLVADINDENWVYTHRTAKGRGDRQEALPQGRWMLDLKTSKDVYVSHQLQLAGYEMAYHESHDEGTDFQGVIQVSQDGRYKLVRSRATLDHFQSIKLAYDSLKEIG